MSEPGALARRIAELSPVKRALLEQIVDREAAVPAGRPARPQRAVAGESQPPLSFAQRRLWMLDQLEPGDAAYNRPAGFGLRGPLDRGALERCLTEIVRRHEVLRATFPEIYGRPAQQIASPSPIALPLVDLCDTPAEGREGRACTLAVEEAERPFDLDAGPLVRFTLYRLGDEFHVLLLVFHHIVFDAWSYEVLWREIAALYPAFAKGAPSPLAELSIQYGDAAAFENWRLAQGAMEDGLAYWRRRLEPPPVDLRLPTDRPEPAHMSSRGARCSTVLPVPVVDSLRALARQENSTQFMVLLAAWQTLLHRISGEVDIAVGTPVANRPAAETEALIGCFVNTLVLRTDLSEDPPFRALLARVRETALGAYAHDVPFDRVVAALASARGASRSPLFRVFLNMRSVPRSRPGAAGLTIEFFEIPMRTAMFDLSLELVDEPEGLGSVISFSTDLFDEAAIEGLLDAWRGLIEAVVDDPDRRLSELPAPKVVTSAPRPQRATSRAPATVTSDVPAGPVEGTLAAVFAKVLGCDQVGPDDDFFELAGHSLLAVQVVARVREVFSVELPVRAIFDAPTPVGLAEHIRAAPRTEHRVGAGLTGAVRSSHPARAALAQERLWIVERIEAGTAQYNILSARRLRGTLDSAALQRALDALVSRHEPLRTTMTLGDDGPMQIFGEPRPVPLSVHDLSALPAERAEAEALRLLAEDARSPFDLARDLMIRGALARLGDDAHVLSLTTHHIASDGWSVGVIWRELLTLYEAFTDGRPSPLPELPIRYADWAIFERDRLARGALSTQIDGWRRRLDGVPPLELPTDRPRPLVQSHRGANEPFTLSDGQRTALLALGRREGATFFMSLLAAWTALLHRLTGASDFAVGAPFAGRTATETEGLVGLFADTLVLRMDSGGDPSFRELLARSRSAIVDAYAEPHVPFQHLVEELRLERDLSRSPFFQTMLVQLPAREPIEVAGLVASPIEIDPRTAKFDLTLFAIDTGDGVTGRLEYATDLFDAATARRLLDYLETLIDGATADPDTPLSALPIVPEEERLRLVDWNQTRAEYPDRPIHELFREQAKRTPDAVALIQGNRRCTYRELDRWANRLAHAIADRRLPPDALVGVFLDRSIEATTAILGVLKAGAAFLLLDPGYPHDRIAYMLDDAGTALLLTEKRLASRLPPTDAEVICLDDLAGEAIEDPGAAVRADGVAYVIYTSGSTGKPKGVLGMHRGAVNRLAWMGRTYPFGPGEVACQRTALGFVDSIAEIFGPLLARVPTVIVPDEVAHDPWKLVRALSEARVTRIVLVPSLLRALLESGSDLRAQLSYLTLWVTSGETLTVELATRFRAAMPHARLVNLYGSSEVAADATSYEVPADIAGLTTIPIGRPIDNTAIYILDGRRRPVPIGIAGEIHVGGDGLAGGYLGQPDLTAERFIPNPSGTRAAPLLYRTGDLGRFRADGEIVFLGRNDDKVKIRGVRVEVGEVEAALESHPRVRAAAVAASGDESGDKRLVAYYVPAEGAAPESSAELRSHLSRTLLAQMVPTAFVALDELPLTPSGKLDRRALPAPNTAAPEVTTRVETPGNPTEETLARIWAELLRIDGVGVNDDFFDLGGHSLLAVRLFARIQEAFGMELPVATLFEGATIARLARVIREGPVSASGPTLVPLQHRGDLPPLFLAPGIGNELITFVHLARRLAPDRPVYGLVDRGDDRVRTIEELADEFTRKIRGFRPEGPYHLGGHSSGATVVIEVARRLRAEGAAVGVVAILDHANPTSRYLSTLPWRPGRFMRFLANLLRWLREPQNRDLGYIVRAVPRKARYLMKAVALRLGRFGLPTPRLHIDDFLDPATYTDTDWERMESALVARLGYAPEPYSGALTVFQAELRPLLCSFDPHLGWSDVASGGLKVHVVPGHHNSFMHEPNVGVLVEHLRDRLGHAELDAAVH